MRYCGPNGSCKTRTQGGLVLGVFAKVVLGESVKTRLQRQLSRQEAESFHVASLADTLETTIALGEPLVLFLQGGEREDALEDLGARLMKIGFAWEDWRSLKIQPQRGEDLGERLENAFAWMQAARAAPLPCLIVGSDSPSLPSAALRLGLERLAAARQRSPSSKNEEMERAPDMVLGPTEDGGYWGIGCLHPIPGLLRGIAWSTDSTLEDTRARARLHGLGVELLSRWTDVDVPEDLPILSRQIGELRSRGDARTARHTEALLLRLGLLRP